MAILEPAANAPSGKRQYRVINPAMLEYLRPRLDRHRTERRPARDDRSGRAKGVRVGWRGPQVLDLALRHDSWINEELEYYEQLGLSAPGDAEELADEGAATLGGRIPVNPNGGIVACGHAIGAAIVTLLYREGTD